MAKARHCWWEGQYLVLATRGVVQHASIVGDLVVGQQQEAHVHAFNDDPKPCHGRPNAHSHEAVLCEETTEQSEMCVSQFSPLAMRVQLCKIQMQAALSSVYEALLTTDRCIQ